MGKLHTKGALENHLKDQSFRLVYWLSITQFFIQLKSWKLWEAKVGQGRPWVMPWNRRSGKIYLAILGIVGCIQRSRKQLTKKFSTDEEGTDLLLHRMWVKRLVEVERGTSYVLFADIEVHGHIGNGPGCGLLISRGKATKPRKDEFRKRVGTVVEIWPLHHWEPSPRGITERYPC